MVEPLSEEAISCLQAESINYIPRAVRKELIKYRSLDKQSVKLYRSYLFPFGVTKKVHFPVYFSEYTSWTYNEDIAKEMCKKTNSQLITSSVHPKQLLVDTTVIPLSLSTKCLANQLKEKKVITKPGIYFVELV